MGDVDLVRAVALATLPHVRPDDRRELERLTTEVDSTVEDLSKVTGFGRLLLFGGTRDKANEAARFLTEYRRWLLASNMGRVIEKAAPIDDPRIDALAGVSCTIR